MSCLLSWGGHNIIKFKEKYLKNPFSTQELVCDFLNPSWPFQIEIRTKADICQLENMELYKKIKIHVKNMGKEKKYINN